MDQFIRYAIVEANIIGSTVPQSIDLAGSLKVIPVEVIVPMRGWDE